MFYVNIQNREFFSDYAADLIAVDDSITNAGDYSVTPDGKVVDAWEYNGLSFALSEGAQ